MSETGLSHGRRSWLTWCGRHHQPHRPLPLSSSSSPLFSLSSIVSPLSPHVTPVQARVWPAGLLLEYCILWMAACHCLLASCNSCYRRIRTINCWPHLSPFVCCHYPHPLLGLRPFPPFCPTCPFARHSCRSCLMRLYAHFSLTARATSHNRQQSQGRVDGLSSPHRCSRVNWLAGCPVTIGHCIG